MNSAVAGVVSLLFTLNGRFVTVRELGTSLAPSGGVMVPPPLYEHLVHLSVS
jgi:hypothetical protein